MIARIPFAILISGRGSNMEALLRAASDDSYPARILLVVSSKAGAPGLEIARAAGVKTLAIEQRAFGRDREAHDRALDRALREHGAELVCLAGYMRLLTPFFVQAWAGRMLNIHPSLLPAFPGLDTHERALEAKASVHGCTVHLVTDETDGGPVLDQARVPVLAGDTPETLAARVLEQEHILYPKVLAAFCASLAAEPSQTLEQGAMPRSATMADTLPQSSGGPSASDGFLADRQAFWSSVLRFVTRVIVGLVVLLLVLWWWLV